MSRIKQTKHEYVSHPLYWIWAGMKQRCYNKNGGRYKDHGGRGIEVCDDWVRYPKLFIEWALSHGWKRGLIMDRKDNDGDYTPENCRFVSPTISSNNQRLLRSNNTTGYRGVIIEAKSNCNPFRAQIRINNKLKHLGSFPSPGLAALRYDVEAYLLNDGRPMNFIG